MAGLGRRTHYRKHLTDSVLYDSHEPGENERIAKVVSTRGGNQFDVLLSQEKPNDTKREAQLAILPTKFNKLVWVKRNDFVIVKTGDEEANDDEHNDNNNKGDKHNEDETTGSIRYIISHILYKDQVKHLQSRKLWPVWDTEFVTDKVDDRPTTTNEGQDVEDTAEDGDNDDGDGIVYDVGYGDAEYLVNTNRIAALKVDDSSDSSDEE